MGQSRKRIGRDGKARFTAYYEDLRGQRHSAGTFASRRDADRAWQRAEARIAEGRAGDPRRGRQTFRSYVEDQWFPHHVIEHSTRQSYTYLLNRYILPHFGSMRMVEILPSQVREWVLGIQRDGAKPAHHPPLQGHHRRHLHDGPQRPGHAPACGARCEDAAGGNEAPADHYAGAVRQYLSGASR